MDTDGRMGSKKNVPLCLAKALQSGTFFWDTVQKVQGPGRSMCLFITLTDFYLKSDDAKCTRIRESNNISIHIILIWMDVTVSFRSSPVEEG